MANLFKIKSFRGGISDWENIGVQGAFKFGSNLSIRRDTDSLTCNQALSDDLAVGTMTAITNFIVPASDGNTYFFNNDGKIYKRTSGGTYSLVYTDSDGAIKGAIEWGQINGNNYLFWATDTKLHAKQTDGASDWSDVDADIVTTGATYTYPKTNLTSAEWHTMKRINGTMLIGNKDKLAMVSYDGSYTNEALLLVPGNSVKTLMEHSGYAYIGGTRTDYSSQAEMFVWDTSQSLNWNKKNTIPTDSINSFVNAEFPLVQVGTDGQIVLADINSYTQPITRFSGGGQVAPDGTEVDNGVALFGVYGNGTGKTGVYSYGRKKKNANLVLNLEHQFDCTEIGSVRKVGSDLLISYKDTAGTGYGIKIVDTTSKATGTYQSIDLMLPTATREPVISRARIVTAPMPSGTSIEMYRRTDKTGNFIIANTEGGSTSFNTENGTEAWFLLGDTGKVAELQLILNSSGNNAPEVYQIELYFE